MKLRFRFNGGPLDGKTVLGQKGAQDEADRYFTLTDHGRVGQRFRTASQYAIDTLASERLQDERPHHFQQHVYEVIEHVAAGDEIAVTAEYVCREPPISHSP